MRHRSLLPREHGAYFQLAIPLIAACLAQRPTVAALALAVAAALAFLAYEPLAILIGGRGARAASNDGPRARRWLALLGGPAILAGGAGLVLAPAGTLAVAGAAALGGVVLTALTSRRTEHSLVGELLAAVVLTGASAVVVAADGAGRAVVMHWWASWAIGFSITVVAVRRVLARHKHPQRLLDAALAAAFAAITVVLWRSGDAIAAPLAAVATVVAATPVRATHLRAAGIAIASVAALSAALAIG